MSTNLTSHRCWVYGDNVNTDVIFPGKYTYTARTKDEIASHALEDLDPNFAKEVQPEDIIVAGRNWGCGSSREQAVTALKFAGIRLIIAASFARIYFRNCINQGLRPIVLPEAHSLVRSGDTIHIDWQERHIWIGDHRFSMPRYSPSVEAILAAGGLVPMLQRQFQQEEK
ncbi:MAG: 3-isopropylmalate dehydratase [Phototrophicales bacterium]|nr:MAG: 3-isopropylmalate dehydratase [Phototrophicales bacterium]